jgi:hypothetical protein
MNTWATSRLHKILEITIFFVVGSPMSLSCATMVSTTTMNENMSWPCFIRNSKNRYSMMCLFSLKFSSCTRIKWNHIFVDVLELTKTFMYFSSIDQHISFMAMLSHFFYFLSFMVSKFLVPSQSPSILSHER